MVLPTDPLSTPSHAAQHNSVNGSVENLVSKVDGLTAGAVTAAESIEQARRTTHEWVVRGALVKDNALLLPILWNLTARTVEYEAAKLTVYTPSAGSSIMVDLVSGDVLASGQYISTNMSTILAAPLEIPPNENVSRFYYGASMGGSDFVSDMPPETFLAAYITQVGSAAAGADLTIQINRLL